jgi:DNA modification methylase
LDEKKMDVIHNIPQWKTVPIESIKPYPGRARVHKKAQQSKLEKVIGHYGQVTPIVVDNNNEIIDGHAVWEAMKALEHDEIAVVVVVNCTEPEIKALRLALNRIACDAGWDNEVLRADFELFVSIGFDLELTGFDAVEIDGILDVDVQKLNVVEEEAVIPAAQKLPITGIGDIWNCGKHRIGCGDACDQDFVDKLLAGTRAGLCFVDPPYNVPISGFVTGKGRAKHREFVSGAGELSAEQFTALLERALNVLKKSASQSALIYACMDWRHIYELLCAGRQTQLELVNFCVWAKTNAGMGSLYRSQHELICVFKAGNARHLNNVELGRHGRNRSNLWTYRGMNSFGSGRDQLLSSHPTIKPVLLIADAIRDVTKRGEVVLDTFLGSGSTIMAAEETGRVGVGLDLDPIYVDVAVRRWQTQTRRDAIHAETGETFEERVKRLASPRAEA